MTTCFIDTETFSATPLKSGTYIYAANAEVMLISYAFDDGPVHLWDRTRTRVMPRDLADYIEAYELLGGTFTAHSSMFDRNVLRLGDMKVEIPIEAWRDTMVKALAHGLPGGLDRLGEILNIPIDQRKLKEGRKLIHLFCKPTKEGKRNTRFTHPNEWERFCEYAISDIPSMRAIDKKLPCWNYQGKELALWHRDQKINDRGFLVDTALCSAAIDTVARETKRQKGRTHELSDGRVDSVTQRDALLGFILDEYGVDLPDLKSDTLERRLNDQELPEVVRDLIAIRLEVAGTSSKKYATLLKAMNTDSRVRGTTQFCGAQRTRRWAGRGFQPQNLMRVPKYIANAYDEMVQDILDGALDLIYEKPIEICGALVRGAIIAPPKKRLAVADLSNIEGRKAAWLCGEEWKLQAFRDFDAGIGPDLYKKSYGAAFNVDPADVEDDSIERQIGKVMELMLQYAGGVGAFITGAATYGIDLDEMAAAVMPTLPRWVLDEATGFHVWTMKQKRSTFKLPDDVFIACDAIKRLWRSRHPTFADEETGMWKLLENACRSAILTPGVTFNVKALKIRRDGAWLRIVMPSGGTLCYAAPQLHGDKQEISYMGINQYTRRWQRVKTYGGKLLENITQSGSRDVFAENMPAVEDAGFEIVLHVHDSNITEAPDTKEFSGERLADLMSVVPAWANGLPLAAKGFQTYRYRK